jgi:methionine salvage enolase-phosphatase E1
MSSEKSATGTVDALVAALRATLAKAHNVDVEAIEARAVQIWDQFKAEEIDAPTFVDGIQALEAQMPEGFTIRFR